ncbi:alpha/beta hydrolase-fold protein [Candidatus Aeolococcus gillhamiae]|uniref:alpha/beta hydrolase n=1 Tax=Candidatus Aeolococcus gillhamiae TaxID=3127015 RepID=UPI0030785206
MNESASPAVGPPWHRPLRGRLDELAIDSVALRGNPLNDPSVRPLWVYSPPGEVTSIELPVIYLIQGFTGQLDMWRNRSSQRLTAIELIDELFSDPSVPPCRVAMIDCWTSLGGSQFLDSPATGRYHTYLCEEAIPFVDAHYSTRAHRDHRAISGKSSGGYGAMITPMLRPDLFGGLASHAGDALFELCYWRDVPEVVRALREQYGGSYEGFFADLRGRMPWSRKEDGVLLNMWAMAAAYSADDDGTVRLPFDASTGQMIPEVWERWLAWDPVRMVPRYADALRSLAAIYIDAGTRDEFFLDLGATAFRNALGEIGIAEMHFELFDAGHMSIEYRYPVAMRYLAERISGS